MQYDSKSVAITIRKLRRKRGFSQEVLSGLAGIARTHLTMIENGAKQPNLETLWRIAQAFNIPTSELVRLIEEEISTKAET